MKLKPGRGSAIIIVSFFLILILKSCEFIDLSPHQVLIKNKYQNLNQQNAAIIKQLKTSTTDTLRFLLLSDTQRFYDETKDFVKAVNDRTKLPGKKIHFALHGGDISDFGLTEEFVWIHEILKDLTIPYLTVIGNHDCVANGKKIYNEMYGPFDYTVQVGRNRFVFLNTNYLEFGSDAPDLNFLENALQDSPNYDNAFILSHVSPFDEDRNPEKESRYKQIVKDNPKVRLSIHGHKHTYNFNQPYKDGKDYLIIGSVEKRAYVVVTVIGEKVSHEVIKY